MNTSDTSSICGSPAVRAMQAFVDLAPLPLLLVDRSKVRYANVAFAELFRYSIPELLHSVAPADLVGFLEHDYVDLQILGSDRGQTLNVECRRKDATAFASTLSFWPIHFDGEKLLAVTVHEADSPTVESELARFFVRTEDSAVNGAFEYDAVTGFLTRSPGLFRILGEPFDTPPVWIEWLIDRVPEEERELVRSVFESRRPSIPCEIEHSIIRSDGSRRTVLHRSIGKVDPTGRAFRTIGVMQDIASRGMSAQRRL